MVLVGDDVECFQSIILDVHGHDGVSTFELRI